MIFDDIKNSLKTNGEIQLRNVDNELKTFNALACPSGIWLAVKAGWPIESEEKISDLTESDTSKSEFTDVLNDPKKTDAEKLTDLAALVNTHGGKLI